MKRLVVAFLALALVGFLCGVSYAQQNPGGERGEGPAGGGPGGRGGPGGGGDMVIRMADTDSDGKVTEKEWVAIFKKIDADSDGVLSDEEIQKFREAAAVEARKEMFKRMDANGDGAVTKDEFGGREQFFNNIDANGDGKLTPEELNNGWRGRGQGRRGGGDRSGPSEDTDKDSGQ